MKKTFLLPILAIVAVTLASCGKSPESGNAGTESAKTAASSVDRVAKDGDVVAVDYVGKLEDGTVFDTSIKSVAEKTPKYNPGREYSPLMFTVGAGQMIKGFDKGVVGMKVGEKKTLTLPPEEAYGTGGTDEIVPKKALQDSFTETVSIEKYQDSFKREVPASVFTEQGKPVPKVGEIITAGGISAKVDAVSEGIDGKVKLTIENRQSPFYGKKLKVGLSGKFEDNTVTIVKLDSKNVTVKVDNKNNPFYGKKLKVGLEGTFDGRRFVIKEIGKDTVTLTQYGELVGKTLIFDIELKEIK